MARKNKRLCPPTLVPTLGHPIVKWRREFGCRFAVDRTGKPRLKWWHEGSKGDGEVLTGRTLRPRKGDSNKSRTAPRMTSLRNIRPVFSACCSVVLPRGGTRGWKKMTSCGTPSLPQVPERFSTFTMISSSQ